MAGQEEEPEITLEEQIHILQEQNVPAEKIVEQILQGDINADIDILANTLKMDKMAIGRIKGRLSRLKKRKEGTAAPTGKPEEAPLYKGELDTTAVLKEILTKHPDIPSKVVEEVLSWSDYGPIHPTQLVSLLQSFRGITATTAYIVAQKYSLALQKAQLDGKVQAPPIMGGPAGQPQSPWGFTPYMPFQGPTAPAPPGYPQSPYMPPAPQPQPGQPWYPPQPQQDVRSAVREELDRREERRSKESEQGYVDIDDPARDHEGNVILGPDERPIMKHIRMPASQAGELVAPREDVELKILEKMKHYKELFGSKEELTLSSIESKMREIVRQEAKPEAPTEKPITLEDVKTASSEAAQSAVKQVLEAHEKEDKEDSRFRRLEETIRSTASAKTVEGYREDGYRILGQGMSETAGVLKERKPIEVIIREGGPLIFGGAPGKEVEAGAGEGLLARLQKRGWVTEQ